MNARTGAVADGADFCCAASGLARHAERRTVEVIDFIHLLALSCSVHAVVQAIIGLIMFPMKFLPESGAFPPLARLATDAFSWFCRTFRISGFSGSLQ